MNLFNLRNEPLDFSDERVIALTESIIELKEILDQIGTGLYTLQLNNIVAAAMKKDENMFIKYTLTNELFGGAGALWELYCGDNHLQLKFNKTFKKFVLELKGIGIKNKRLNQVID